MLFTACVIVATWVIIGMTIHTKYKFYLLFTVDELTDYEEKRKVKR